MQYRCRAPGFLEQRGIQQEGATIGEGAQVPVLLAGAPAAPRGSRSWGARHSRIEVQVAPERCQLFPPPVGQLGQPGVEIYAEKIYQRGVDGVFSSRARGAALLEPPRQIALQPCHHGQQVLAVDALDQLTMPRGVSQKSLPVILVGVVANETRGNSPTAQGDVHSSGGSPGCGCELIDGAGFSHDIRLLAAVRRRNQIS